MKRAKLSRPKSTDRGGGILKYMHDYRQMKTKQVIGLHLTLFTKLVAINNPLRPHG